MSLLISVLIPKGKEGRKKERKKTSGEEGRKRERKGRKK
jgi:hypothetical protein